MNSNPRPEHTALPQVRLHHLDYGGEGAPTVLLHGVAGHARMWDELAPLLRSTGNVLALDLRGYGDSQWDPDGDYSTEHHASDVADWIEARGLGRVRLVGFSWGGLVALHLAATRPELVERLAVIDIAPSFAASELEIPPLPLGFETHAEALAAERRQNQFASEAMIETMARFGTRPGPDGRLVKKHDPVFGQRWPFRNDDRWDQLGRIEQPLLLVRAAESQHLSAQEAERMLELLGDARLAEIPRSGHLIPVDNPTDLGRELGRFLETGSAT